MVTRICMFPFVNIQNDWQDLQAEVADVPVGWITVFLGSGARGSFAFAASLAPPSVVLVNGIGDGKNCLGKPLKNQAPDLFHTWEINKYMHVTDFPTDLWTISFVYWCKSQTSRCSLQILHSHTARGRLPHCVPHFVHMFYSTGEKKDCSLFTMLLQIVSS